MVEKSERFFLMLLQCQRQWLGCSVNRYSETFRKIHKKTPMLESLFDEITETPTQWFSYEFCQILRTPCKHLKSVASEV